MNEHLSAQLCGCDLGCNHLCARHQAEADIEEAARREEMTIGMTIMPGDVLYLQAVVDDLKSGVFTCRRDDCMFATTDLQVMIRHQKGHP